MGLFIYLGLVTFAFLIGIILVGSAAGLIWFAFECLRREPARYIKIYSNELGRQ